jgi:hypothetical protein
MKLLQVDGLRNKEIILKKCHVRKVETTDVTINDELISLVFTHDDKVLILTEKELVTLYNGSTFDRSHLWTRKTHKGKGSIGKWFKKLITRK